MIIEQIQDIELFLHYLHIKNNSMAVPMWKEEHITLDHFNKIYSAYSIFLIKEQNVVIGGFLLLDHDYTYWNEEENQKSCFYIHKLFILNEYNKKGYSPKIMEWIKNYGRENHKESIRLDSRGNFDRLNHYYDQLGFQVVRQMESPYTGIMNLRELKL